MIWVCHFDILFEGDRKFLFVVACLAPELLSGDAHTMLYVGIVYKSYGLRRGVVVEPMARLS